MSKIKLSMTVDRLPFEEGIPVERRGRLLARICASDDRRGDDVTLIADGDDTFDHTDVAAMLRIIAATIDSKYSTEARDPNVMVTPVMSSGKRYELRKPTEDYKNSGWIA